MKVAAGLAGIRSKADPGRPLKAAIGDVFSAAYLKLKHQEWNSFVSHFSKREHDSMLAI